MTFGLDAADTSSRFWHVRLNTAVNTNPITAAAFSFEWEASKLPNFRAPTISSNTELAPYDLIGSCLDSL